MPQLRALFQKIAGRRALFAAGGAVIILAVILAVWLYGRPNPKALLAARQTAELAETIRRHYQSKPDYWGLNTESLLKSGKAPKEMIKNGRLVNALGLPAGVGQGFESALIMPGTRSFDIVYTGLLEAECRDLAQYNFSDKQKLGLISVSIKNDEEVRTFSWGGDDKLPINNQQAKAICQKNSAIIWRFE